MLFTTGLIGSFSLCVFMYTLSFGAVVCCIFESRVGCVLRSNLK
jgi:hypothetical protein